MLRAWCSRAARAPADVAPRVSNVKTKGAERAGRAGEQARYGGVEERIVGYGQGRPVFHASPISAAPTVYEAALRSDPWWNELQSVTL